MSKRESDLQLFRLVRRGYDPRQVLSCIKEMTETFKQSEDWHTQFQEALREEYLILRLQSEEDKKCLVEAKAQLRALKMENQQLRRRLVWEGKDEMAAEETAAPASASPPDGLPGTGS